MNARERNALIGNLDKLMVIIDDMDKDWVCSWEDEKQEKFYIVRHECGLYYISSTRLHQILGLVYMQKKTAEHILNLISKKG